jgi:Ser/Thr protein kinase RdoA (MazF antagonist)
VAEIRDAACVIGHGDWHGGNVRFLDGRPLAVHDWDSALYEPEVVIAGQAAAVFQDARTGAGASAGQSEAFLEAYQSARERAFSKAELQLCWPRACGFSPSTPRSSTWTASTSSGGPKQNRG